MAKTWLEHCDDFTAAAQRAQAAGDVVAALALAIYGAQNEKAPPAQGQRGRIFPIRFPLTFPRDFPIVEPCRQGIGPLCR